MKWTGVEEERVRKGTKIDRTEGPYLRLPADLIFASCDTKVLEIASLTARSTSRLCLLLGETKIQPFDVDGDHLADLALSAGAHAYDAVAALHDDIALPRSFAAFRRRNVMNRIQSKVGFRIFDRRERFVAHGTSAWSNDTAGAVAGWEGSSFLADRSSDARSPHAKARITSRGPLYHNRDRATRSRLNPRCCSHIGPWAN